MSDCEEDTSTVNVFALSIKVDRSGLLSVPIRWNCLKQQFTIFLFRLTHPTYFLQNLFACGFSKSVSVKIVKVNIRPFSCLAMQTLVWWQENFVWRTKVDDDNFNWWRCIVFLSLRKGFCFSLARKIQTFGKMACVRRCLSLHLNIFHDVVIRIDKNQFIRSKKLGCRKSHFKRITDSVAIC